jgi:hypothetical protein
VPNESKTKPCRAPPPNITSSQSPPKNYCQACPRTRPGKWQRTGHTVTPLGICQAARVGRAVGAVGQSAHSGDALQGLSQPYVRAHAWPSQTSHFNLQSLPYSTYIVRSTGIDNFDLLLLITMYLSLPEKAFLAMLPLRILNCGTTPCSHAPMLLPHAPMFPSSFPPAS